MSQRTTWMAWSAFGIIVIVLFVVLANAASSPSASPTPTKSHTAAELNIKTGDAPWPADEEHLAARLESIGLPQLSSEGTVLHIHQHLDIFVHGKPVAVPAGIGIGPNEAFIADLHTHDASGIIHVESPEQKDFTLGQFMTVWGVKFDQTHLGGYAADATNQLQVYVNGKQVSGDPRQVKLASHQEIVITFGTPAEQPSTIPSSYQFQQGL